MHAREAANAYRRTAEKTASLSALEADLLLRYAAELRATQAMREDNFPRFVRAVSENLRLWTVFAADAVDASNGLSGESRDGIYRLSRFVAAHSQKLLQGAIGVDVAPLAAINENIAAGLKSSAGGPAP